MPPAGSNRPRASSKTKSLALNSSRLRKRVAAIVGEPAPAHLREPHAPGTPGFRQKKGRVVFPRAFGRRRLGDGPHSRAGKILQNHPHSTFQCVTPGKEKHRREARARITAPLLADYLLALPTEN